MMNDIESIWKKILGQLLKFLQSKILLIGFLLIILAGGLLLMLPFSSNPGKSTGFIDAMFTAISAMCVTGLVVFDTNTQWSIFGQFVILLLIQVGALGIMSVVSLYGFATGRRLGLQQRLTMQESINNFTLGGVVRMFRNLLIVSGIVEAVGAIVFSIILIPRYGIAKGILKSVFHSVSAFCNAGFDVFGKQDQPYVSLMEFSSNPLFLLMTGFLIIFGGLGFIVWNDVAKKKRFMKLTLHTKIVLTMTPVLLLAGTIAFFIIEYHNSATLGSMTMAEKLLNAFFHSVTARTAGFNSISTGDLHESSGFFTILLMAIGAAPGSTAGGFKITTVTAVVLSIISFLRNREHVHLYHSSIPNMVFRKSVVIMAMGMALICLATMVLLIENSFGLYHSLYESVSAFGTVGLSQGITADLGPFSKIMLMVTMIAGRIGPLSLFLLISTKDVKEIPFKYPDGTIVVG